MVENGTTEYLDSDTVISVIVPVYNEEAVIRKFYERVKHVLNNLPYQFEIVFANDGSDDNSLLILKELKGMDNSIGILDLSRNFGKEIAMAAALDHVVGDAVIVIDADLQDPPELIPSLIEKWREGHDVVYAKRTTRKGESFIKKITARWFYRFLKRVVRVKIPEDTGDFRLLSRRAVAALRLMREQHRFTKGLFAWIGFPQVHVFYERDPRYAGKTKWNYWRLWNFAIEGITSFTSAPLYLATYLGLFTALGAMVFGCYIIMDTLIYGNPIPGYPSLMAIILFLGGIQLITIGIIGEYLGRTYDESKQRPLYFLQEENPSEHALKNPVN